ncbi:histidine kinase [Endozoicomonas sp. OPT23]|uniref:cache domain-containing protein n=1 Tax=Endozoicomonas sp. OPT23 TaxID=2072845 RepID=UPI001DBF5355|nr:histidine kinase [Endozoicomonas sp. OPT23]
MSLKIKILLLALLPLILTTAAITWITQKQAHDLFEQEIKTFEENLIASKRQQLKDYVSLANHAIEHSIAGLSHGVSEEKVEEKVKTILHNLRYDTDGYFFAYRQDGVNVVHPPQPELVGQNLMDITDSDGTPLIKDLLEKAAEGGGFSRYKWVKPSVRDQEDKLSYVMNIPHFNWMIGTGLYLDDVTEEVEKIRKEVNQNIRGTFFTVLMILSGTIIIIILIGLAINVHESNQSERRLQEMAHRSLQVQVTQRRQFARELHDGINQLMVSIKLRINLVHKKWNNEPLAKEHLGKAAEMLDMAIQEVRRVSHDLRPILLDDLGLRAALDTLMTELTERSDVQVKSDIRLPDYHLPDTIEITLYRIVQEALTNIEKHAGAATVSLKLWQDRNHVYLELHDDGVGFDELIDSKGIGLSNMRERAELLGGSFDLYTSSMTGTRIRTVLNLALTSE